ncbi:50S ribosomal protein L35 [Oscillospiraceae bacterium HV4-5-C5C]|nr:50S ribosomal protein L35 [Oscillospiraceae bacterium HV4-5-C5C]
MPKQKSHSSSKKRYKISGTGKVIRFQAFKKHKAAAKSPKRRRNLRGSTTSFKTDENRIKQMIPYK